MIEKEPTIEYESNSERSKEIPKDENLEEEKRVIEPQHSQERDEKKIAELAEKEKFYKEEVEKLVEMAKEEGFEKAFKKAKKLSKKEKSSIIIDLFHDRFSEKKDD